MRILFNILFASMLLPGLQSVGAVLTFEHVLGAIPFEGLAISNQFAGVHGMRFSGLQPDSLPIIIRKGRPARAFTNSGVPADSLYPTNGHDHGEYFLGDPEVDLIQRSKGFVVAFDSPVSTFSLYILDLDADERVTLIAYASHDLGIAVATNVVDAVLDPPGFGRGLSRLVGLSTSGRQILAVEVRARGRGGYPKVGFDDLSSDYVAPSQEPAALIASIYPGITISGTVGTPYRIEFADALDRTPTSTNWNTLTTLFLPWSPFLLMDASSPLPSARYYRAVGQQGGD